MGWFAYMRKYRPDQAAFDKSWKPGDFKDIGSIGTPCGKQYHDSTSVDRIVSLLYLSYADTPVPPS